MKKTIKHKLLRSYLVITVTTIMLVFSVLYGFIYVKKINTTVDLATKLSKIMGTNLAASLAFYDVNSAKAILESLQVDNTIEAALVYDKSKKLFSSHINGITQEEAIKKLELIQNDSIYHDLDNIIVTSKISLDNETIGKLVLLYNTDDIKSTLKQMLLILIVVAIFILIVMFKIASILQKRLTKPIYILVNTMKNILEHNNYTETIDEKSDDEFQTVFNGFNTMLNRIQKNKSELENLANIDSLTGLYNRRHFFELVNPFLDMSIRENKVSAILMLDIDNFKNVNDTYGHDIGDEILQNFAKILLKSVRKGDIVARFGGEEFIVFLPHSNAEKAMVVAQKIRNSIEVSRNVQNIEITVSIGLSEFIDDLNSAIKKSDIALYKAKENGRNRVEYFRI